MTSTESKYCPCWMSSVGAMTGLAKSLNCDVDETQVAGVSGFAFRLAVSDQVLPVFNSSYVWFDVFQSAFDRLGIVASIWKSSNGQLTHEQQCNLALSRIAQTLNCGKPSMVWESFEFGLLIGIDETRQVWKCEGVSGVKEYPNSLFGFGEVPMMFAAIPAEAVEVDKARQAMMSLRLAVSIGFSSKPPYPSDLHVVTGVEGYRKWADELSRDFNTYGNSLLAQLALESRKHAALYLARVSKMFEGVPQNLLLRASERYAQVNSKLSKVAKNFPFPGKKEDVKPEKIAESIEALNDCFVMETEGLQLIATAVEHLDAKA